MDSMMYRFKCNGKPARLPRWAVRPAAAGRSTTWLGGCLLVLYGVLVCNAVNGQSLNSLLNNAQNAKSPGTKFAPAQANPFAHAHQGLALGVRRGTVELSDGRVLTGKIWTTLRTPFRVWLDPIKQYRDMDIRLIKSIHVKIIRAHLIRQWRWQQEGSDIKVYSGLTKPRISFAYRFTMLNGKTFTGTLIAPLYVRTAHHRYNLLMYKRIEGKLGERLGGIIYVKAVHLQVTPAIQQAAAHMTRILPVVDWRKLMKGVHLTNSSVDSSIP